MPLYEYTCKSCDARFEQLVRTMNAGDAKVKCPKCGSAKTARALSVFAVNDASPSSSTSSPSSGHVHSGSCGM